MLSRQVLLASTKIPLSEAQDLLGRLSRLISSVYLHRQDRATAPQGHSRSVPDIAKPSSSSAAKLSTVETPQRSLINQRRHPWPGPAHRASHRAPWTLGWLNALLTPPAISPEIPVPTVLLRGRRLLERPDPRQRPGSRRESRQDPAVNYPGLFCVVFWKKGSSPSAAGPVPVFGRRVDFPRD